MNRLISLGLQKEFMGRFEALLHSHMDTFDNTWAKLVEDYTPVAPVLVEYLRKERVEADCNSEVFDCFLDQDLIHFGQKTTLANEGAHARLKEYLIDSSGDLLTVLSKAHTKIQNDVHKTKAAMA